jgi:RNA polymerase sigma factor (sigma-70 family)
LGHGVRVSVRLISGESLPLRLVADDESLSFDVLFGRLLRLAHSVGHRFFPRDAALAADVAQESLTRAYVAWDRLRVHPNIDAWIVTTALHVAFELSRTRRRTTRGRCFGDGSDIGGEDQRIVDSEVLVEALLRLSRRQRQVLVWRYYFDQSVRDTADRMGLSESQVKDATHEATVRLRRLLGAERVPLSVVGSSCVDSRLAEVGVP